MQLKPITAIAVLLLVIASLLVSGCTAYTSNPSPTVTPTPAPSIVMPSSTPKASASQPAGERDDKAIKLEEILSKQGKTVVTPFTKSVNKNGNDVYTGTFKDSKYYYNVTIEVCKSSGDSASIYSKQVAQLKGKGFSTYNGQESNEQWVGYNANSKQSVEVKRFTGSDNTLYVSTMFAKK